MSAKLTRKEFEQLAEAVRDGWHLYPPLSEKLIAHVRAQDEKFREIQQEAKELFPDATASRIYQIARAARMEE